MATFKSAFDKNSLCLIIDVREPDEYASGYIPGAINIPRDGKERHITVKSGDRYDYLKKPQLH